jgi:metallophosphoesterase superfamily enzyme
LGETVERVERDGWLFLHGDRAPSAGDLSRVRGVAIGHLHPSLPLGAGASTPAFLAGDRLVVLPALTPYSRGLDVFSDECMRAIHPFNGGSRRDVHVIAASGERLYPFGTLSELARVKAAL